MLHGPRNSDVNGRVESRYRDMVKDSVQPPNGPPVPIDVSEGEDLKDSNLDPSSDMEDDPESEQEIIADQNKENTIDQSQQGTIARVPPGPTLTMPGYLLHPIV